jgi:formylglycine-generating enzyme required for sulfatase activity
LPPALASSDGRREKLAKRQANAAVALFRLGQLDKVWPLLKHPARPQPEAHGFADPRLRSYLIDRLGPLGADPEAVVKRLLEEEKDISVRRALLLCLGEFSAKQLTQRQRAQVIPKVVGLYREDADAGLHAAAEWLLRHWGQEDTIRQFAQDWVKDPPRRKKREEGIRSDLALVKDQGKDYRGQSYWYVNAEGQTMVVIPGPVEFLMGSPSTEEGRVQEELRHRRRIGRTFAIAAAPVTREQFSHFLPKFHHSAIRHPDRTCPIGGVDWYRAAAYCNWLSDHDGIAKDQWCYETDQGGTVTKVKENYLSLMGYRLPTEAEWEYACRAGAVTSRYYGETEELLAKYAWYVRNSEDRTWPVGSKKPNDLGLFDMHGHVFAWCQERHSNYAIPKDDKAIDDKEEDLSIAPLLRRILRGGSVDHRASNLRCAERGWIVPSLLFSYQGLRPVRTIAP